jgi:hypothetical protein
MNISRLSTLSLTLAVAVFSLGYVNPSAAKPFCPGHPSCKPPPDNPIKYTAELTGTIDGAFVFAPVIVTPDEKEVDLQFETNPLVSPLGGDEKKGDWAMVFNSCDALVTPVTPPKSFMVNTFGGKGGGVRVGFIGIVYGDPMVDVVVQLIGNCFNVDECNADFFPEPGNTSDFTLLQGVLQGHTLEKPKGHCNKDRDRLDLLNPGSTLVITASCRTGTPATNCT